MAIVEMKKLTLLALKRDREKLMRQLQKLGCVQIVEGTGGDEALAPLAAQADPREAQLAADVARMDAAIARLTPLAREKRGIFEPRPAADAQLMENIRKNQEQILGWVAQVDEVEQERLGKTLSEYVGEILEQYFEQQKGGKTMSGNSRTLAFQVSEELFERLKAYLTANKLKQKEFVVGLIEKALEQWEVSQAANMAGEELEGEAE